MDILKEQEEMQIKRNEDKVSNALEAAKNFTYNTLAKTDWYIIRNTDIGAAIPDEIKQSRAEIREKFNTLETTLNAIDTNNLKIKVPKLVAEAMEIFSGTSTE
jgi:hypothetical protein